VLYLAIAGVDHFVRTGSRGHMWSLGRELSNWDGNWYLNVARYGYAHHLILTHWNTLGFLPLFPMLIWLLVHALPMSDVVAGVLISTITGATATVLIARLVNRWFGEDAVRRGILFLLPVPGVDRLLDGLHRGPTPDPGGRMPAGMEDRRWVLAGVLAGLSTAVGPVALAIIPACAARGVHGDPPPGWPRPRRPAVVGRTGAGAAGSGRLRDLPVGPGTGTPLASYKTQKIDWHETTTPLAVPRALVTVIKQALGGGGLAARQRRSEPRGGDPGDGVPVLGPDPHVADPAPDLTARLVWTGAIVFMTLTSNSTPPNARMLICAFPVLMTLGAQVRGRAYTRLLTGSAVMLIVMSMITFVSTGLRP